ncbi:discoidin domain-containing protein [Acetobacter sp. AN02]|uniref:discoidin domain-containing protein n=1 Tax=Acetobacter sp. AN02 TaxID=2894186 RepID=UPI0024344EDB|nr:discoidin domain-containing protein [Acetobacter sp. AN02]MDG6095802.1 discoidin domain-containing protein [Acetobacter sp. AN02]
MSKIYDLMPFYNEFDLMDIRLNHLYNHIDYFVICEAGETFTGQPKEKLFYKNRERFSKFLDKVIYLSIDKFPDEIHFGKKEFFQKQYLLNGVKDAADDDYIIFGDVDEIPRISSIQDAMKFDGVSHLDMPMYQYYLNMLMEEHWKAPYIIKKKYIPALDAGCPKEGNEVGGSMNYSRFSMERIAREQNIPYQVLGKAGWHFTFMGGAKEIVAKLSAYSHANDYWPRMLRDEERAQQALDIGIRIWSGDGLARYVPVDDTFPEYIYKNREEFIKRGFIRDIYEANARLQDMFVDLRRKFAFSNTTKNKKWKELGNLSALEFLQFVNHCPVDLNYAHFPEPIGKLVSAGCPATQSSVSPWSRSPVKEEDAGRALNGDPNGDYSFHTGEDLNPWWEVDLGRELVLSEVRIFNRINDVSIGSISPDRSDEIQILVSSDRENYKCIYYHNSEISIGGIDGNPLIFHPKKRINARYVRIQIAGVNYLHLDKIYIYEK